MCNINILVKSKVKSYVEHLTNATAHSYANNSDGEGVFFSNNNVIHRSFKKINLHKFANEILKSNFILTHQRLATSGFSYENLHPFVNQRFVLVHNGVLNFENDDKNKSDTFIFFEKFNNYFKQTNNIKKAIEKVLYENKFGSYSIFIYDKLKKEGYYFKNSTTSINFYRLLDGSIFITTSAKNDLFFEIKVKIKIESDILYNIKIVEDKVAVLNEGKLNVEKIVYANPYFGVNASKQKDICYTDEDLKIFM